VHLKFSVIANESELSEAVHEEADAGSSGANHLSQDFLTNLWDCGFRLASLAELQPPSSSKLEGSGTAVV
jgi:hypothetical protein